MLLQGKELSNLRKIIERVYALHDDFAVLLCIKATSECPDTYTLVLPEMAALYRRMTKQQEWGLREAVDLYLKSMVPPEERAGSLMIGQAADLLMAEWRMIGEPKPGVMLKEEFDGYVLEAYRQQAVMGGVK